jgi:hypothetical protein
MLKVGRAPRRTHAQKCWLQIRDIQGSHACTGQNRLFPNGSGRRHAVMAAHRTFAGKPQGVTDACTRPPQPPRRPIGRIGRRRRRRPFRCTTNASGARPHHAPEPAGDQQHRKGASRGAATPAVLVAPRPPGLPLALVTFWPLQVRRTHPHGRRSVRRPRNVPARKRQAQPSAR